MKIQSKRDFEFSKADKEVNVSTAVSPILITLIVILF